MSNITMSLHAPCRLPKLHSLAWGELFLSTIPIGRLKVPPIRKNAFLHPGRLVFQRKEPSVLSASVFTPNTTLGILDAYDDEYGGVIIEAECLPTNVNAFASELRDSVFEWTLKVDTAFLEVIAFRHAHRVAFEKSDLLFLCMLKPLSSDITIDEKEIQAAKWMPLKEYIAQPFFQEDRMLKMAIDICVATYENRYHGFTANQLISKFDGQLSHLYYNDWDKL